MRKAVQARLDAHKKYLRQIFWKANAQEAVVLELRQHISRQVGSPSSVPNFLQGPPDFSRLDSTDSRVAVLEKAPNDSRHVAQEAASREASITTVIWSMQERIEQSSHQVQVVIKRPLTAPLVEFTPTSVPAISAPPHK